MNSKKALQIALVVVSLIPILGGIFGFLTGAATLNHGLVSIDMDAQYRYLSAVYLAVGITILWMVPKIEQMSLPFRIIAGGIILGGVGRLISLLLTITNGTPPMVITYVGIVIELGFVPLLMFWQLRVSRKNAQ